MNAKILFTIIALCFVSCTPQISRNGMFKTDLQADILSKTKFNLDNHKILLWPGGHRTLLGKIGYFEEIRTGTSFSRSDWRNNVSFPSYDDIRLDLEQELIEGSVLFAQSSYSIGLIHSQNLDLIDLGTGQVILTIRVPIANHYNPYAFKRRRETNAAIGNAIIEYISENSNWHPSVQFDDTIQNFVFLKNK